MSKEQIDNSSVILQRFLRLFSYGELSDLKLVVGHREFNTHKFVLCMSSDVFRTMLTSRTWPEAYSKRVVLQEELQCVDVFEEFLKYLYNGQIELKVCNVLPLLTLADKYNIADLSSSCIEYMYTHCVPDAANYIISWQQYAMMCGYKHLEDLCRTYITNNFDSIMQTKEFKNLSRDILLSYLDSSDLVVSSEYNLHSAVIRWTKSCHCSDTQYVDLFQEVVGRIRFPMMPLAELAVLETDQSVHRFKDFYLSQIFLAMKFHTSSPQVRQQIIQSRKEKELFMPRNYLCETWSTVVEVENLGGFMPGEVTGAFFTTPVSCSEYDKHNLCDWHVDLYPKGVKFDPCVMISIPRNLQIHGALYKNVRVSITTNCLNAQSSKHKDRFQISLLMKSSKGCESEYICKVVSETPLFNEGSPMFHFNNIVPYNELTALNSPYTVNKDKLKIVIIVKPVV